MKRKLLAIAIVVVFVAAFMIGCSSGIFEVNGNRDFHQVVATVNYNSMSEPIYKGDVLTYYNQYAYMYMQYYGMTSEQVVEYFYETLSRQKLMLLYAKDYLAKNDLGITDDAAIAKLSNVDFLTVDERRYCIEQANEMFEKSWKDIITEREKEQEANQGTNNDEDKEEEEDEDLLAARPSRDEEETSDEYEDEGLTDESKLPEKFTDYVDGKIEKETDKDTKKIMQSALDELNKNLESNYKTYDYYLNNYYETRIVEKYEEMLGESLPEITQEEIDAHYNELCSTQISSYVDEAAYKTAVESSSNLLYHVKKGYSQVRSILFKFSEEQSAALKNIQSMLEGNDDAIEYYRSVIALGKDVTGAAGDSVYENLCDLGIEVNVSNPDYDADEDELKDAYTDLGLDYRVVLYAMADDIAAKLDKLVAAAQAKGITDPVQLELVRQYAVNEAITDWMYLVNDDEGMFSKDTYVVTPEGSASDYVAEYNVLARQLASQGIGSYAMNESDDKFAPGSQLSYTVEEGKTPTEMFQAVNGKTYSLAKVNYESKNDTDEKYDTDVYTLKTEAGNSISFIINDYGIQLIFVKDVFVDDSKGTYTVKTDAEGNETGYVLNMDYRMSAEITVKYVEDAEGNKTDEVSEISVKVITVKDYISKTLEDMKIADNYTNVQNKFLKENADNCISKNEKLYKSIIKEVQ